MTLCITQTMCAIPPLKPSKFPSHTPLQETDPDIRPKLILKSNLAKSLSSMTSGSVVQSFWNFAQSTMVILSCYVQNCKRLGDWHGWYGRRRFCEVWVKNEFRTEYYTSPQALKSTKHCVSLLPQRTSCRFSNEHSWDNNLNLIFPVLLLIDLMWTWW